MKYWETIADNLKKAGWSLGWVSALDSQGRTIWIADAHRDDRKRYVCACRQKADRISGTGIGDPRMRRIGLTSWEIFSKLDAAK
jgi:hypothetical protein